MDVTKTQSITRAVMNGHHQCVRNVRVQNIEDKCLDLQKCLAGRETVFGFLPITNLKRLKLAYSVKPNVVLNSDNFNPVTVHKMVKSTGKYNFEEAKIQLPSNVNFD